MAVQMTSLKKDNPDNNSVQVASAEAAPAFNVGGMQLPMTTDGTAQLAQSNFHDYQLAMREEIRNSGLLDKLTSEIDVTNPVTINHFGKEPAEKMAGCAAEVMKKYDVTQLTRISDMMTALQNVMDRFDKQELMNTEEKKPNFLQKVFGVGNDPGKDIQKKYDKMSADIGTICTDLKKFEMDIEMSNRSLNDLYQGNIEYFKTLMAYIMAAEEGLKEIDAYKAQLQERSNGGDPEATLEISAVDNARQLLQKRSLDLSQAQAVALQSLPLLKAKEFNNLNLASKIQSAFIVTIPVFQNAVAQAILDRQTKMQAQALSALDEATDKAWAQLAQSTVENMKLTTQLASGNAMKVETIENAWNTIMNGIKDTQELKRSLELQNQEDIKKLEQLNNNFMSNVRAAGDTKKLP